MPKVILTRFRVRGFRSCKDAGFSPTPDITALIGLNGSGKTNFLQALMLLRTATQQRTRGETDSSATKCQIEADFLLGQKTVYYRANLVFRTNERRARDEVIELEEKWNFKELRWQHGWIASPWILSHHSYYRRVYADGAQRLMYLPTIAGSHGGKVPKRIIDALNLIRDFCGGINYYSASQFTNPTLCPTSFEVDDEGGLIPPVRENRHSQFLYDLFDLHQGKDRQYESFQSLVGKQGLHLIDKITWKSFQFSSPNYEVRSGGSLVRKTRERKLIVPTIHMGSSRLSFNQLSEGTFRTVALLFYVITGKSTLLLLEEPEVCVHLGLLSSVIEVIKDYSSAKQIIFSTHSESVVDKLNPEQIRLVQSSDQRGTTVRPISKMMSARGYRALKEYLEHTGNLGEYWRTAGFSE